PDQREKGGHGLLVQRDYLGKLRLTPDQWRARHRDALLLASRQGDHDGIRHEYNAGFASRHTVADKSVIVNWLQRTATPTMAAIRAWRGRRWSPDTSPSQPRRRPGSMRFDHLAPARIPTSYEGRNHAGTMRINGPRGQA